jgi:hypothetical protein
MAISDSQQLNTRLELSAAKLPNMRSLTPAGLSCLESVERSSHAAKHFDQSALRCRNTFSITQTCPFAFSVCW